MSRNSKYKIRRVTQRTAGLADFINGSRKGSPNFHFFAVELNGKRIDSFLTARRAREKVKLLEALNDKR